MKIVLLLPLLYYNCQSFSHLNLVVCSPSREIFVSKSGLNKGSQLLRVTKAKIIQFDKVLQGLFVLPFSENLKPTFRSQKMGQKYQNGKFAVKCRGRDWGGSSFHNEALKQRSLPLSFADKLFPSISLTHSLELAKDAKTISTIEKIDIFLQK